MTKKKHAAREALGREATALSGEVMEGKWNQYASVRSEPIPKWVEVIAELERRCPGHAHEEYVDALARSYINNR